MHRATPPFIVTESGCAPPIPPSPAVSVIVPASEPPKRRRRDLGEALVGPLEDSLTADVDPRPGRHLAVHRQSLLLEPPELVPVRPLGDEVRVCDQHSRRPLVSAKDADGLPGLDQQRLVAGERPQLGDDRVEGLPGARRAAGAAVDDEVVGALGDVGVEVVHQHPQRRLLLPPTAGQLSPMRSADGTRTLHAKPSDPVAHAVQYRARCEHLLDRSQLRREPAIGAGAGTPRVARPGPRPVPAAGLQRRPQLDPAGGGADLDREDPPQVGDDGPQLAGGAPAHRDVVLLHRRGRQRVGRGGDGEAAVLGDHRRLRVLGDHQARVDARIGRQERRQALRAGLVEQAVGPALGDRADLGGRDREEVAGHRDRRAVEVPARLDPAVGQDHRVVDRRGELGLGDPCDVLEPCRARPR